MHLVLSGEGKTDIGELAYASTEFIAGSMYFIIDKIIEQKYKYSCYSMKNEKITFISEKKLTDIAKNKKLKKLVPHTGKNVKKETAYFLLNAMTLAEEAKEKAEELNDDKVIAIFFRDSDGTRKTIKGLWEDKVKSIEKGFKIGRFDRGVAMMPNPKSEAWLICALKNKPYKNCHKLEDRSGNDKSPNYLKGESKSFAIENSKINEMIQNGQIDIEKIDMPSFKYFTERLQALL